MDTRGYIDGLREALGRLDHETIARAAERLDRARREGRMVFIAGNGGSAATASHFANDLNKLASSKDRGRFQAMCLTDSVPLLTAWANDESYDMALAQGLSNFASADDVLVALTTSGQSTNILEVATLALSIGLSVIVITANVERLGWEQCSIAILTTAPRQTQQEDVMLAVCHMLAEALR